MNDFYQIDHRCVYWYKRLPEIAMHREIAAMSAGEVVSSVHDVD